MATRTQYTLSVPLDGTAITHTEEDGPVKVVAQGANGAITSTEVDLRDKAEVTATLTFARRPSTVKIAVGPATATDDHILTADTLTARVPGRVWLDTRKLTLAAIKIGPWYWGWWRRWCRTITVRGRLICPDGSRGSRGGGLRLRHRSLVHLVERAAGRLHHDAARRLVRDDLHLVLRRPPVVVVVPRPAVAHRHDPHGHRPPRRRRGLPDPAGCADAEPLAVDLRARARQERSRPERPGQPRPQDPRRGALAAAGAPARVARARAGSPSGPGPRGPRGSTAPRTSSSGPPRTAATDASSSTRRTSRRRGTTCPTSSTSCSWRARKPVAEPEGPEDDCLIVDTVCASRMRTTSQATSVLPPPRLR